MCDNMQITVINQGNTLEFEFQSFIGVLLKGMIDSSSAYKLNH